MSASVHRSGHARVEWDQKAEVRTSGRSCSHGVGERERERLRMVRKDGKYRSISIASARKLEGPCLRAKFGCR
jgi:hypothetical protein